MTKVKANVIGLSTEEVIAVVDRIDALMSIEVKELDVAGVKTWKADAVALLKECGCNFVRVNNKMDTLANELGFLAGQCENALEEYETVEGAKEVVAEVASEVSAAEESPVAEENTKEEIIMEQPLIITEETFTPEQEALIAALISGGVTREQAIAQMKVLAAMNPAKPAPSEEKPAPKKKEKKEEKKEEGKVKAWFSKAVSKLDIFSKDDLVAELVKLKLTTKDAEEKAEIEAELAKLRSKDGDARFAKMKEYITKSKGWTVDASGKVADALYVTGDYTEKAASTVTKATGKVTKAVGEHIVKAGQFIEDNADSVGKAARMPADLIGDTINVANGTKKFPKSSKTSK